MLWLAKRVIFGETKNKDIVLLKDLNFSESLMLGLLATAVIFFGFYPSPLLDTVSVSADNLIKNYQTDIIYHLVTSK